MPVENLFVILRGITKVAIPVRLQINDMDQQSISNEKPSVSESKPTIVTGRPTVEEEIPTYLEAVCANRSRSEIQGMDLSKEKFVERLRIIDGDLPALMRWIAEKCSQHRAVAMVDLVERMAIENPLGFDMRRYHDVYEWKIRRFLLEYVLGLVVRVQWRVDFAPDFWIQFTSKKESRRIGLVDIGEFVGDVFKNCVVEAEDDSIEIIILTKIGVMADNVQSCIEIRGPEDVLERIEKVYDDLGIGEYSDKPKVPSYYVLGDIAERLGLNRAPIDAQGWSDVTFAERIYDVIKMEVETPWGNTSAFRMAIRRYFSMVDVFEETF